MEILLGNKIDDEITPISEIAQMNEACFDTTVEGEIFGVDIRGPFKNGSFLYKGAITDNKNSIYFQFFTQLELKIKDGMALRLNGYTEKNQYTRGEYVFMVENAMQVELAKNSRKDESEEKRVELSVVGNYSTHISAMEFKDIVKQAKEFGHKTIAITDIGAAQGFPEAYKAAKENDLKLILGMKIPVVDDSIPIVHNADNRNIEEVSYTVFDVETTGFSNVDDYLIEIGASKFIDGKPTERFQCFIKPPKLIPQHITELTHITQKMVDEEGITLEEAIEKFHAFWQGTVLVAHNAQFDRDFMKMSYKRVGRDEPKFTLLDTLQLSRMINTDMKQHNLDKLTKKYKVKLEGHHRADQDAEATGEVLMLMLEQVKELGIHTFNEINEKLMNEEYFKTFFSNEVTLLVKNKEGLRNLYRIVSLAHTKYLGRVPMLPKRVLNEYREGLFIGSGSFEGRLFELALNKMPMQVLEEAKFYDYLEIEPEEIASHLWKGGTEAESQESIRRAWKTIYLAGKKLNKPVIATGDVHYVNKEDRLAQHILMYNERAGISHERRRGRLNRMYGYAHFRSTIEMMEEIGYLNEEEKHEVVIENSNKIAEMCDMIAPLPEGLHPPIVEDANDQLKNESIAKAKELYGDVLPPSVQARLDKELDSILGNGFAVIYTISRDLVKKSNSDGYIVGSRGSVGSSFVATMLGITEVNPLKPHYRCPSCQWTLFFDHEEMQSGYDLPNDFRKLFDKNRYSEEARKYFFETFIKEFGEAKTKEIMTNDKTDTCPHCGYHGVVRDGQDIPFETFLGFKGDKVPDIDLNFSGEYQPVAHRYVGELFGFDYVFRAGTIGTVADKTAYGYTKKYLEEHDASFENQIKELEANMKQMDNAEEKQMALSKIKELRKMQNKLKWSSAEITRIAGRIVGAKRTTGQHPGGMLVVPNNMDMSEFGGYQYPANDLNAAYPTSHFAFEHIHDNICKLDILGHDDPTILRILRDSTGIEPKSVPSNDEKVLKLFTEPEEALGIPLSRIEANTGTLGVPEFGTDFTQQMVIDTKPKSFAELVKISGLSHGTDVWLNNAQDLVRNQVCEFKEVIGCRDDIMVYLMQKGLEPGTAFTIMEYVRKGKAANPANAEKWAEYEAEMRAKDVPEWYIESCKKIKYMFPKAHAAAYVLSAMRIAYFKVYYPIHYYAAMLSVRWEDADVTEVIKPANQIRARIQELYKEIDDKTKTNQPTAKEKDMVNYLKVVLEAKERGIKFGNIRIYGSNATRWTIHDGVIIPPFVAVPGLGGTAAEKLEQASKEEIFKGVEDLRVRGGVNKTTIDTLRGLGCLKLIESEQHTFF